MHSFATGFMDKLAVYRGSWRAAVRAVKGGADSSYVRTNTGGFMPPQMFKAFTGTPGAAKTRSLRLAKWRRLTYKHQQPPLSERIGDALHKAIAPRTYLGV